MSEQQASHMGEPRPSAARYYRPELDWVRFLAFLCVFMAHAFNQEADVLVKLGAPEALADFIFSFVRAGVYGVDLFFALSAFLITELLLREKDLYGKIDIKAFYIRRILRIWPLYFAFLFVVGPLEILLWKTGYLSYYLSMLFFVGNWHYVFSMETSRIAAPLWSISVEEQFYVTWPILAKVRTPARMAAIMGFLIVVSFATRFAIRAYDPTSYFAYWCNTFARLDPFACGGLLALALHKRPIHLSPILRVALLAISAGLLNFIGLFGNEGTFGKEAVITLPAAALASVLCILAFVSGTPSEKPMPGWLRMCSYLGKISYGLYVFHKPGLLLCELVGNPGVMSQEWWWVCQRFIAAGITLIFSMVAYRYLEKPFLELKKRFAHIQSRPA